MLLTFGLLALLVRPKYTTISSFGYVTFALFFTLGYYDGVQHNASKSTIYFGNTKDNIFLVKITDQPVVKSNSIKVIADVVQTDSERTEGTILLYLEKDSNSIGLELHDQLIINTKPKPITVNGNPKEFDYKRYLKIHDIHHQSYLNHLQWQKIKSDNSLIKSIYSVRRYLDLLIDKSAMNPKSQKIAKALLLGEKEYLDKDILNAFSSAGAMHVLAVSGLHVGIVMLILQFILRPLKLAKYGKLLFVLCVLSGVWTYAIITGLSPSVIRAAIMFSFIVIGLELQRQSSIYQSIMVSAFIILLFDPFSLFKVGFQLSFLAVLGIVIFQPKIYKLIYFKWKAADYLWQITSVSFAAQLATFPLGLYYFHQFPNLFMISNLFVIPFAGLILIVGFLYFTLHIIPIIKTILETILDLLLSILNYIAVFIEQIPYSIFWGISISVFQTFLIYLIIILASYSLIKRHKLSAFLAFGSAILFFSLLILESNRIQNSNTFVVYNIKNDFALDIFYGKSNHFICSKTLMSNDQKLQFHIKHHWYYRKGAELQEQYTEYDQLLNPIITMGDYNCLIINKDIKQNLPITDFVILENISYVDRQIIAFWKNKQTKVIIHPNIKSKVSRFIQKEIAPENIYNIRSEGAFVLNF